MYHERINSGEVLDLGELGESTLFAGKGIVWHDLNGLISAEGGSHQCAKYMVFVRSAQEMGAVKVQSALVSSRMILYER